MHILAIETSCDETAIAVLDCEGGLTSPTFRVLGNALSSQVGHHREWGGVVPMIAKREHIKWLPILLEKVLKDICDDPERPSIDLIAVTTGPGLEPALWAGITFAEALGKRWRISVIPVNHMEGHILSVLAQGGQIAFPALALLVSGGHTELVEVEGYGEYRVIGRSRDDAVGEAFDKVGRMLGLPYPAGPAISAMAARHRASGAPSAYTFPMPMLRSGDLNFSYSGLKTAVLYAVKKVPNLTDNVREAIARSFEDAAIGILVEKTRAALETHPAATLIVGGGVSGNTYLQARLQELLRTFSATQLLFPPPSLTTDNAVMIGMAGYLTYLRRPEPSVSPSESLSAQGKLSF